MDVDYEDFDSQEPILLDLYQKFDPAEAARKGGVKSYETSGDASVVYDSRKSDYYTTVERVLGLDGWETLPTPEGSTKQRMTLLILKVVVNCTSYGGRVRFVKATLSLDNQKSGGKTEPFVEAWAPFRKLELTNPTRADIHQGKNKSAKAGFSAYGFTAQGEGKLTHEISFERNYYDRAFATVVMDGNRRAGVSWYMEQNNLEIGGVQPETFLAVLFKRETDDPYIINFDIDVGGGTLHEAGKRVSKLFGLNPGRTKPFLVRPSTNIQLRGEGRDFLPAVETLANNLERLRATDCTTGLTILQGLAKSQVVEKKEGPNDQIGASRDEDNLVPGITAQASLDNSGNEVPGDDDQPDEESGLEDFDLVEM
ncbi:hypothetical protein F5Y10DRAFT_251173 [Nemania abortiva]|nr:hypothetical protein F5Y10DRAFT_251173 [Nemania abortiva]